MPLILPTLQADLISVYEKGPAGNPAPPVVGIKTAKAYNTFLQGGINVGGGSTTAMPGVSALGKDLGDILSSTSPDGSLTANKMAKAFDMALASWISLFQSTIVTAPGMPGLVSGLTDIFSKPQQSSTMFANKLAKELKTYTLAAIVSGVTPDTPGVPFSGPIS